MVDGVGNVSEHQTNHKVKLHKRYKFGIFIFCQNSVTSLLLNVYCGFNDFEEEIIGTLQLLSLLLKFSFSFEPLLKVTNSSCVSAKKSFEKLFLHWPLELLI